MFAQHYADSRGKPSKSSWDQIVKAYGLMKAKGILGAIRIIMMGNAYGIPWGSLLKRFKGKSDTRSSLFYELTVAIVGSILIPIAMIHSLVSIILHIPLFHF